MEVIRNRERAELLLINEVREARSEILLASSSVDYLEHLAFFGLVDMLERAKSRGVQILILCPAMGKKTRSNDDSDYYAKLLADIDRYAQIENTSGQIKGTILVVDNSRVLSISEEGVDALAIYSNSKSLVNNFGSLFEALWMEREMLQNLVKSRNELLKSNEQLKIHDKMQQEFVNIAAHELRTPIQPILGITDILKKSIDNGNKEAMITDREVALLDRNARRLQKLSSEILDATRIEAGTLKLQLEAKDINEEIRNVIEDMQDLLRERQVQIQFAPPVIDEKTGTAVPLVARIDKLRVFEVISNLIRNAAKYSDEGDTIFITAERKSNNNDNDDGHVLVSIKDRGSGISPEIFSRLFTKFSADREQGGIGLGLYLAKNIIEAHGGKIWAENNVDGKGTTFTFTLPLAEPRADFEDNRIKESGI